MEDEEESHNRRELLSRRPSYWWGEVLEPWWLKMWWRGVCEVPPCWNIHACTSVHVVIARRKILSEISSDSPAVSKIDSEDEVAVTVDQSSAGQHSQCTHGKNKFHVNIFGQKDAEKAEHSFYQTESEWDWRSDFTIVFSWTEFEMTNQHDLWWKRRS